MELRNTQISMAVRARTEVEEVLVRGREEKDTARPEHLATLNEEPSDIGNVIQSLEEDDDIERVVGKRHILSVELLELDPVPIVGTGHFEERSGIIPRN